MLFYKNLRSAVGPMGMAMVISFAGCGAGPDGRGDSRLLGKWSGQAAGVVLTLDVREEYGDGYYTGSLGTSSRPCFIAGMMVGRLTGDVVDVSGSGSGSQSQSSILRLTGELLDGRISGLVSMTGDLETPCDLEKQPVVLSRL